MNPFGETRWRIIEFLKGGRLEVMETVDEQGRGGEGERRVVEEVVEGGREG